MIDLLELEKPLFFSPPSHNPFSFCTSVLDLSLYKDSHYLSFCSFRYVNLLSQAQTFLDGKSFPHTTIVVFLVEVSRYPLF